MKIFKNVVTSVSGPNSYIEICQQNRLYDRKWTVTIKCHSMCPSQGKIKNTNKKK